MLNLEAFLVLEKWSLLGGKPSLLSRKVFPAKEVHRILFSTVKKIIFSPVNSVPYLFTGQRHSFSGSPDCSSEWFF